MCLGIVSEDSILVLLGEVSFVASSRAFHVQGREVSFSGFFHCVPWPLLVDDVLIEFGLSGWEFCSCDQEDLKSGFHGCAAVGVIVPGDWVVGCFFDRAILLLISSKIRCASSPVDRSFFPIGCRRSFSLSLWFFSCVIRLSAASMIWGASNPAAISFFPMGCSWSFFLM